MISSKNITNGDGSHIFNNDGDVIQNFIYGMNKTINPYNLKKVIGFIELELEKDPSQGNSCIEVDDDLKRIDIVSKNDLNQLEEEGENTYFINIIESSIYFKSIKDIIANPRNQSILKSYNNIKKTLRNKIPEIRTEKQYFYQVLNEIIDQFLNSNDQSLLDSEEMVSVIVHFMYYMCHIGDKDA